MTQNPEAPDRDIQIELVYQRIAEPYRGALRSAIPSDSLIEYSVSNSDADGKVTSLYLAGGEPYTSILAVAAASRNSHQLANAFGALAMIQNHVSLWPDTPKNYGKRLEVSENYFLDKIAINPTPFASDDASSLQAQMISYWNQNRENPRNAALAIRVLSGVDDYRFEQNKPFWAESYLLTILDPNTPRDLRKLLINNSGLFEHGRGKLRGDDSRFGPMASFWQHVNASWVYPDIYGQTGNRDIKDWEIAGLRKNILALHQTIDQQANQPAASQEYLRLQQAMAQLEQIVKQNEEKLAVYKTVGQHPLEALGIGHSVWRMTPADQRGKLLKKFYWERAKKYHYQVPHTEPRYDPLTEELANKEFSRLTTAQEYLAQHLNQDEF